MSLRVAVIGAGPSGLCAAHLALRKGCDVTVLEADRVGSALLRWGSTRLFSPMGMNLPPQIRQLLGDSAVPENALLTGPEMIERVLRPLVSTPPLAGRVREGHRVRAVGRAGLSRQDYIGHPLRSERAFRLLVETDEGEYWLDADRVLDASGATARGTHTGPGGLPSRGERGLERDLVRDLGALERRLPELSGRRVLLLGHAHSAATALLLFEDLAKKGAGASVTWAVRTGNRRPCVEVASDPLEERQRVVDRANALAQNPPDWLTVLRRSSVESYARREGRVEAVLPEGQGGVFDAVIAMTGWRPDLSFLSELALEISPSTEGAARLSRALAGITDCLSVPRVEPRDLESGEPGFYLVGAKSYGRSRSFLLKDGYAQMASILETFPGA